MREKELIPHLFRSEFSKIVAVLIKSFGIGQMALAEDLASETFAAALETWPYNGIPEHPVAWLYTVAKNKAKNEMRRTQTFSEKIVLGIKTTGTPVEENDIDLSETNISDSQLQMLFAICHPSISQPAQIGLALRILCGFGIDEIANAFLTNKETINKRLFRAREKLREEKVPIGLPPSNEIQLRLNTVLTTLYLLFNEGYYSESQDTVLREDLCLEAMRLTHLLLQNEQTNTGAVNALLALMCFHASRFPARKNEAGEIILYCDQNESLWNLELVEKGIYFLNQASQSGDVSKYHLEAGIAFWHTRKADSLKKWEAILQLYNRLLQIEYSPVAALNRTYALSKVNGALEAIKEAEELQLKSNHYYYTLLGELYRGIDREKALENFRLAYALAKSQIDKQTVKKKIQVLEAYQSGLREEGFSELNR